MTARVVDVGVKIKVESQVCKDSPKESSGPSERLRRPVRSTFFLPEKIQVNSNNNHD